MTRKEHILQYQELSSNAWPARTVILLNGWAVRLSEGVTKRANSVLPIWYNGQNVLKDIKTVERLYRERNLPVIFQVPDYFEPDNLTETLMSSGYSCIDESLVMTAEVRDIKTTTNNEYTYSLESESSDYWFQSLAHVSSYSGKALEGQRNIIESIPFPGGFLCAHLNNEVVGIGLGILEREYLGIFDLIVHPFYRRRGIGQSMVGYLVEWAHKNSVFTVYLQVQGDNSSAISLYRKIGFKECYRYRYFVV